MMNRWAESGKGGRPRPPGFGTNCGAATSRLIPRIGSMRVMGTTELHSVA